MRQSVAIKPFGSALLVRLFCLALAVAGLGAPWSAGAGILPKDSSERYELIFWDSVKDSKSAADYEAYLEAYPEGKFVPLAEARIRALRGPGAASPKPESAAPAASAGTEASDARPPGEVSLPPVEPLTGDYELLETANIRAAPSARGEIIVVLIKGATLQVSGYVPDRDWYRLVLDDGSEGYVFGELVAERQAAAQAPAPAPLVPAGELFSDCDECPELVLIQPGRFTMGSEQGGVSEQPVVEVALERPYAIGAYAVSVAQWQACVAAGGCAYKLPASYSVNPSGPARNLNHGDALEYVGWLAQKTGKGYRLPTEAEWEYAARGGTASRYWWGSGMEAGKANCEDCGGDWDPEQPAQVDAYPINPFGLYGVSGGVWEWTGDCWTATHEDASASGAADETESCRSRVLRGGSWRNSAAYATTSARSSYNAGVRFLGNGLRVVRDVD